ncbi:methylated-DNA--[protein]-cysteine S-methyltransferase [Flavobacterium sp. I3-2]|uniref:methylated-DNA--[protein]-cysteine S-methyltransferase n=1 Tax=Flavobacterium sp. I3-2 TaxID=2748319 RepID=UPI0015AA328C|nr:methylated-DNA--[protein]-cysteine S-methyltransferase [Flavobacterium sp. I3-2]
MNTSILDILKQMNLPIRSLNQKLFEQPFHDDLKVHLMQLNITNSEDFIQEISVVKSIDKLKSFAFTDSNHNFKLVPFSKQGENELDISYEYYQTKIGTLLIASTNLGICYVAFETKEKPALPYLKEIYKNAYFKIEKNKQHQYVLDFIDGNESQEITFHIKGTDFQMNVWNALLDIPKGSLTSYGEIAKRINKPKAFRAVGTAIGNNPISLLIPCHRVIQSNGSFGGYMWGLPTKFLLIGWEGLQK